MMPPVPRRPLALSVFALCGALLAGCGKTGTPAEGGGGGGKKKGAGGPAPVIVGRVQKKVVPLVIDAIGAVEPIRSTAIRTQVTGTLTKIAIAEGANVKEGDLLFEIDPRPYQNALLTAEADVQKAKVQLATARTQVDRYKSLTADQMVSKEQFEKIMDSARALEAEVASDEAKVATAKVQLEYCSIRAPLSGRTGNMNVHEGDLVRANANDATAVLMTINQLSPIYVTFSVPQQYLGTLTRYRQSGTLQVRAVPPGNDEKPEDGTLTFMDNMVDASTGTLKLKGTFPNPGLRLWPGQFVTVTVTLSSPEVLTIPASAVQTAQNGQHVFVVKDGIADIRPVLIERNYEADAVIAKGLQEGETVVIDGQLRVIPKKPVEIKDANPAPGASKAGKGGGEGGGKKKKKKESGGGV
jgi:multidrug efflux system membrane fusion protein